MCCRARNHVDLLYIHISSSVQHKYSSVGVGVEYITYNEASRWRPYQICSKVGELKERALSLGDTENYLKVGIEDVKELHSIV